jgi:hypothetical protein
MKRLWIPFLIAISVLSPLVARSAVYRVIPTTKAANPSPVSFEPKNGIVADVSSDADALFLQYGYRPPYKGPKFAPSEHLTPEQAEATAPYLLVCESGNQDGQSCGIDSNGKLSCGRAQFQDWSTFWEPTSGISGDPLDGSDAIFALS